MKEGRPQGEGAVGWIDGRLIVICATFAAEKESRKVRSVSRAQERRADGVLHASEGWASKVRF